MITPRLLTGAARAGQRIGLFGGSFNPAHDGHRAMSLFALQALHLDQVWWLVSPQNPLKSTCDMAPFSERMARARAIVHHPRLVVSDLEVQLGTRYTARTLAELRRRYPRTRFVWLMGADNLTQMPRWCHWQRIFGLMPVAAFNRAPYSLKAVAGRAARRFARHRVDPGRAGVLATLPPPAWVFLRNPEHPASATAIRSGTRPSRFAAET
ncbi:MAG: nicotinate-nucleotide adenylyltransferase [Rhodospirillaceae bacterium]